MKTIRLYTPLVLIASSIIALDQWTKWLVRTYIPFGGRWLPEGWEGLMDYARIVHWTNTGVAFGMFQGAGYLFAGLAVLVAILIFYYYPQVEQSDWWLRLAMGMQLAGALGNLIDRLRQNGAVTDFVSVGTFPVWNVADASITMGVVVLIIGLWWKERQMQPAAEASAPGTEASDRAEQSASDRPGVESAAGVGDGAGER